jgi:hypothetical protein
MMLGQEWNVKVNNAIEAWYMGHEDADKLDHLIYLDTDLFCMCCGVDFSNVVWEYVS